METTQKNTQTNDKSQTNDRSKEGKPTAAAIVLWYIKQIGKRMKLYLVPTIGMSALWLVLTWLRNSGIIWAALWPLQFITGALAGTNGSLLGGTIGKAIILLAVNSAYQNLIIRRGSLGTKAQRSLKGTLHGIKNILLSQIPQIDNIKYIANARGRKQIGGELVSFGLALFLYPFVTGDGRLVNSMVCLVICGTVMKQLIEQRGLLITILNLFMKSRRRKELNRTAVDAIAGAFAIGMALTFPIAALNIPVWITRIIAVILLLIGCAVMFIPRKKAARALAAVFALAFIGMVPMSVCAITPNEVLEQSAPGETMDALRERLARPMRTVTLNPTDSAGNFLLSGPDVIDGQLKLERGRTYNFTYQQKMASTDAINDLPVFREYLDAHEHGDMDAGLEYIAPPTNGFNTDRYQGIYLLNDAILAAPILTDCTLTMHFYDVTFGEDGRLTFGDMSGSFDWEFTGTAEQEAVLSYEQNRFLLNNINWEPVNEQVRYYGKGTLGRLKGGPYYRGDGGAGGNIYTTQPGNVMHFVPLFYFPMQFEEDSISVTYKGQTSTVPIVPFRAQDLPDDQPYFSFHLVMEWVDAEFDDNLRYHGRSEAQRAVASAAGAAGVGLVGSSLLTSAPTNGKRKKRENGISLSLTPFSDALLNTKGASVSVPISVEGGEGRLWHYSAVAICPGALKAVVVSVIGNEQTAALTLNLTGTALNAKERALFVMVWATSVDESGNLSRAYATTEFSIHEKGLDAWWEEKQLKVKYYHDTNMDGIAETVDLNTEEYEVNGQGTGMLTITAKDAAMGSCTLSE